MQTEIRKRARLYGVAAILLAVVLVSVCYNLGNIPKLQVTLPPSPLKTFSSYNELRDFLGANAGNQGYHFYGFGDVRAPLDSVPNSVSGPNLNFEHSTTNIQVAGVDEADTVKTDGEYVYVITGNNVSILKGYPPEEAQIVSRSIFNDTYPVGIFVRGGRLVVLGNRYSDAMPLRGYYGGSFWETKTVANVYDISDRTNPELLRTFMMSGSYFNSRLIGDYVYFVISQPAYLIYDTVILPKIYTDDEFKEMSPTEVHYSDGTDSYYLFTTFVALNMQDTTETPKYISLMLGGTSGMYVSLSNIYVTFPDKDQNTNVYRISVANSNLTCEAQGKVFGRELNQFSMDEYDNHFRIATTTQVNGPTQNNLYVLNMNLSIVGSVENMAPGEAIDSARFMGDRCYLATSIVRRDPFFVIDVENASDPKVLGYLKIPGFSRYLHPYDESHMIGVGRDENNSVKISLFDVSNVSAPVEMDRYAVEGSWSDTSVLTDHKAFLFDRSKDLLVIPASAYNAYGVKGFYNYYDPWQGALVFNITLTDGFVLRGTISHQEPSAYDWDSTYWVKRTFYVRNVLYTVSDVKVKLNSLDDLAFIKEVPLG